VLRDGRADAEVVFEGDDEWESFHLAAVDDDGTVVGVVSFSDRECPRRPKVFPARQLRGMAVAEDRQGQGLGSELLAAGVDRCRAERIAVVWAHARLPAVDFYVAHGLTAEGDAYDHPVGDGTLPHRIVVLDLA
jgi:predicted N-acetyltransferase YhbS